MYRLYIVLALKSCKITVCRLFFQNRAIIVLILLSELNKQNHIHVHSLHLVTLIVEMILITIFVHFQSDCSMTSRIFLRATQMGL